eukprot:Rmarinus@m.20547
MEQLLGQPDALPFRRTVYTNLPIFQSFQQESQGRNIERKRLVPVSALAAIPANKGDAVALSYDAYRDAVWVVTSDRFVGCYLVCHGRWMNDWIQLVTPADKDVGDVHDFVVMRNRFYVIPHERTSIEVYSRRGELYCLPTATFSQSSKLIGIACSGDDLFVGCERSSVYHVSVEDPFTATLTRICDETQLHGLLSYLAVSEDASYLTATVVGVDDVDIVHIPLCRNGSGHGVALAQPPRVVSTVRRNARSIAAVDDRCAVSWYEHTLNVNVAGSVTRSVVPYPVLRVAVNGLHECFVLSKCGLTVFDNSTCPLAPCPLDESQLLYAPSAKERGRCVSGLAFDRQGLLWVRTDTGSVLEYCVHGGSMMERFRLGKLSRGCFWCSDDEDGIVYASCPGKAIRYSSATHTVTHMSVPEDGCHVVYLRDGVPAWHVQGGSVLHVEGREYDVASPITTLGVSSDGHRVLVGAAGGGAVFSFLPHDEPMRMTFKTPPLYGEVVDMVYHKERLLVATSTGALWLVDGVTGDIRYEAPVRMPDMRCVAVRAADGLLAVGVGREVRCFRFDDWFREGVDTVLRDELFCKQHSAECRSCSCYKNDVYRKQLDCLKYDTIKTEGRNIRKQDLHTAAYDGRLDIFRYVADEVGAEDCLRSVDQYGNTVLHNSASENHLDVVKYLVEEKGLADLINVKNSESCTAYDMALCGRSRQPNACGKYLRTVK